MTASLSLTSLEVRDTPAAFLSPGGQITVSVSAAPGPHTVSVDTVPAASGPTVQVTEDGVVTLTAPQSMVTSLFVQGAQNSTNIIQNNTNVTGVLIGGSQRDSLFGGTGLNVLDPKGGPDEVYALLGTNVITSNGQGRDRVLTNIGAVVNAGREDAVVRFFGPGRTPGSGFIGFDKTLNDGVLYITPTNNGSTVRIDPAGRRGDAVNVTFDLGDGKGLQSQSFAGVKAISFFGGTGSDFYTNNTKILEAAYGSGGDDVLISGTGDFALLKGSGGNDTLIGRAASNDLSGNGGSDNLVVLTFADTNVFRTDANDTVFGAKPSDILISP